jgi:hypothetical protein
MESLLLGLISLLCLGAGAFGGFALRARLPEHHLTRESSDVVKLAAGLIGTLVALVLSLLVQSANGFYNLVDNEYGEVLTSIRQLDDRLKAYGPGAQPVRDMLRGQVIAAFQAHWKNEQFGQPPGQPPVAWSEVENRIIALSPTSGIQRWNRERALEQAGRLDRLQTMMRNQYRSHGVPLLVLVVVLTCASAIFGSFGLYTEPNGTVIAAIAAAALAVSSAMFLIVELNSPFEGLLQLSSHRAHVLVDSLGR